MEYARGKYQKIALFPAFFQLFERFFVFSFSARRRNLSARDCLHFRAAAES
ncbi:MAG: hypothetical protein IIY43_00055 [Oscillospiraceae bacterium]|jgi:hypothetical protein|nr:hypothetical protein [Oscillospiraceae bacterium]